MVAIGSKALQDPNFYCSIHQKKHEISLSNSVTHCESEALLDRISAMDTQADEPCSSTRDTSSVNIEDVLMQIKEFTEDFKAFIFALAGCLFASRHDVTRWNLDALEEAWRLQ